MDSTTPKQFNGKIGSYHFEYVKKNVDLSEFIETEIGCRLAWTEPNISAHCVCPLHGDTDPSFSMTFKEEDAIWIYQCFGCGAKGTIIDFVQQYHSLPTSTSAVAWIFKKFGWANDEDLMIESLKGVQKKINLKKKMECANVVTSNQCRMLLRKDYSRYGKWVAEAYKRMNKALDEGNIDVLESMGYELSNKLGEK
ncbi:hypothetical protein D4R86_01095 [bacterium]|nr:MAG: hypothetical protein D4R86_01095 [bacterium]